MQVKGTFEPAAYLEEETKTVDDKFKPCLERMEWVLSKYRNNLFLTFFFFDLFSMIWSL